MDMPKNCAYSLGASNTDYSAGRSHEYRAHPMGRVGEIQEIADAVLYLEDAAFLTGEILHVEGGAPRGVVVNNPNRRSAESKP